MLCCDFVCCEDAVANCHVVSLLCLFKFLVLFWVLQGLKVWYSVEHFKSLWLLLLQKGSTMWKDFASRLKHALLLSLCISQCSVLSSFLSRLSGGATEPSQLARLNLTPSEPLPPNPILTRFGPENHPFRVRIRSTSGQNRVQIRTGGRGSEGVGSRGVGPAGKAL